MNKKKIIAFDMDGTLYDLYNTENWLSKIESCDITAFTNGKKLFKKNEMIDICNKLKKFNFDFAIISWLPKRRKNLTDKEFITYCEKVEEVKKQWVNKNLPFIKNENIFIQSYGEPKQRAAAPFTEYFLIDDNKKVCENWETKSLRKYFNVSDNFTVIDALKTLYSLNLFRELKQTLN